MLTHPTRRAARESLDAAIKAKVPTDVLIHRACASFAEMVAEMTGEPCTVWIGSVPIVRKKKEAA